MQFLKIIKRAHVLLTEITRMGTSGKTIIQRHTQDADMRAGSRETLHHHEDLSCPFIGTRLLFLALPLPKPPCPRPLSP